jgi:hypothetical protein
MRFRIAHRAIEAWLLADVEGIGTFFKVASAFAGSEWSWKRAALRSDSLRRCIKRIAEWS